jgi:RNA polymerase sigma-70 factor (ECF subfamily)
MSMMNEKQCIADIIKGNHDQYRQLVDRYQAGLIIHCENITKSRHDGEDLAQEAFIKAYKNLVTFSSDKASFSTWLYRIATNLCIDYMRRNKRKVSLADIEERIEATESAYQDIEMADYVQGAMKQLEPPKYASILRAYYWEGRSYDDIAKDFHVSINTIGTWIRRAKQQLKENLS